MSERDPKPKDMGWLNPYIVVKDTKKAIEFYEKAFGFNTRMTIPDKEGNIMHAELGYKDAVMMMGPEGNNTDDKAPSSLTGTAVSFYLYVEDIDKYFEHAKSSGAKVVEEPKEQFWGDKTCKMECPEGHHWMFAQNVSDFDPSKSPF